MDKQGIADLSATVLACKAKFDADTMGLLSKRELRGWVAALLPGLIRMIGVVEQMVDAHEALEAERDRLREEVARLRDGAPACEPAEQGSWLT